MLVAACFMAISSVAVPSVFAGSKAFDVREEDFFSKIRQMVVLPCRFSASFYRSDTLLARSDSVKWQLDSLITARLQTSGMQIVSGHATDLVHSQIVDSLGGLFDEVSGEVDSTRFAIAERRSREILRDRHHPDAWVLPVVYVTTAQFQSGTASWDGVKEKISAENFGRGFLKNLTGRTSDKDYMGQINALSLAIAITDDAGKELYLHSGGLHTLSRFNNRKFTDIARTEYLRDETRLAVAVAAALKPFEKAARKHGSNKR